MKPETQVLLQQIWQLCIIPLLTVLTTYIVKFINKKTESLQKSTDNELYKKYIALLDDTITKCVIATNQTYVDSLKNQNAFTKEAQEEAFKRSYDAVMAILSIEAKTYLQNAVGDLDAYIRNSIQAQVKINKISTTAITAPQVIAVTTPTENEKK
jgi:hypothetical protein